MEQKPGTQTSEFKLTVAVMILGAVLDGIGVALGTLKDAGMTYQWLPLALVVVGSAITLFKAMGYTRSRTLQKLAELQPQAVEVTKASVPFVVAVAKAVKELEQPPLATPPDRPSVLPQQG